MYINKEKKLERIWMPKAQGTLFPISQIPTDKLHLPSFAWLDHLRPKSKEDVFKWKGKTDSEKLRVIERQKAPVQRFESENKPKETTQQNTNKPAEENHEKFHAGGPFSLETGEYIKKGAVTSTYNGITSEYLTKKLKEDPLAVVINAGTPGIVFNRKLREQIGSQFIDVGIAEEQAVTMTTGLAKNGAKPVWAVLSTFLQRTYDQLSHDMALNNQAGVVLVYSASINSMNDESHLGFFDIPFISHIPNFVYLAPTNKEEHLAMLEWAINQNEHPVAIRVPVGSVIETGEEDKTDYSILNKNKVEKFGEQVAIFGVGNFYNLAEKVSEQLKLEHNIEATLVNPRFLTGLDKELLNSLEDNHKLVVTVEDGIVEGGYGQTVASYLGNTELKVQNYGINKKFYDRYKVEELMEENGLTVNLLVVAE